jgi:hypothetical protein
MEEIKKSRRGGKREGAGRHKSSIETTSVSFLMEKELCDVLKQDSSIKNRGKFINNALRFALKEKEEFLKFVESLNKIKGN